MVLESVKFKSMGPEPGEGFVLYHPMEEGRRAREVQIKMAERTELASVTNPPALLQWGVIFQHLNFSRNIQTIALAV